MIFKSNSFRYWLNGLGMVFAAVSAASAQQSSGYPAVAPADVRATFRLEEGFDIELIAAEPLIESPVAIAIDEYGAAYVVEMRDYPYTNKSAHKAFQENSADEPIGRIRKLLDTDGDGVYDQSHIFADGLSWPTGVICWQGGIYVTATPSLIFLKDTNGDHQADIRREVFKGFRKYNVQAVINTPIWSFNNRIVVAGSSNGGVVSATAHPDIVPVTLKKGDFSFDPRLELLEPLAGGARFANTFDEWGNRFICGPGNPGVHVVNDGSAAERNPYLAMPNPVYNARHLDDLQPLFKISPPEKWRVDRAEIWAQNRPETPASELVAGGEFTSASGLKIYGGDLFPEVYHGDAFVAECANNLVHRMTVKPDGVTFRMRALEKPGEFLASSDTWFRPVNLYNAPDGSLLVVDMYRETIEHPWSLPDNIHADLNLLSGRDRGRIYRVYPADSDPQQFEPLGGASLAKLVEGLEGNAWTRSTSHRLLFERNDAASLPLLRTMFAKSGNPVARMHALWLLEGLGADMNRLLADALLDEAAGVREHAVRIIAREPKQYAELVPMVLAKVDDPSIRVRYQVAFALGAIDDERIVDPAVTLLASDGSNRWLRSASLSVRPHWCDDILAKILERNDSWTESESLLAAVQDLAFVVGAQADPSALERIGLVLETIETPHALMLVWAELGRGLSQSGHNFASSFGLRGEVLRRSGLQVIAIAQSVARSNMRSKDEQQLALRVLGAAGFEYLEEVIGPFVSTSRDPDEKLQSIKIIADFPKRAAADILIEAWMSETPVMRDQIMELLLRRDDHIIAVLDAVEDGRIVPGQLSTAQKVLMSSSVNPEVKRRYQDVLVKGRGGNNEGSMEKFKDLNELSGDAEAGSKVFMALCAACHRFGRAGGSIGPSLESVKAWDDEAIVLNIVQPNREVGPDYMAYMVETTDGSSYTGMITAENAGGVTLKPLGSEEIRILRKNILTMKSMNVSLMPEGLGHALSAQDMADLLAFIKQN